MSFLRRSLAFFGSVAVLLALAAPVAAGSPAQLVIDEIRMPDRPRTTPAGAVGISPPAVPGQGVQAHRWQTNEHLQVVVQGLKHPIWPEQEHRCERSPEVVRRTSPASTTTAAVPTRSALRRQYLGTTHSAPNCNSRDGQNVVGFGKLDSGMLAVTCYWISNGKMVEADMKITTDRVVGACRWRLATERCRCSRPRSRTRRVTSSGSTHVGESEARPADDEPVPRRAVREQRGHARPRRHARPGVDVLVRFDDRALTLPARRAKRSRSRPSDPTARRGARSSGRSSTATMSSFARGKAIAATGIQSATSRTPGRADHRGPDRPSGRPRCHVMRESVARCSRQLELKYPGNDSLEGMLRPSVLGTTLRLEPLAAD